MTASRAKLSPYKEVTDMKKKITAAILTLAVIVSCSAAFAADGNPKRINGKKFNPMNPGPQKMRYQPTAEEKAQFEKICSVEKELKAELSKDKPDKAKAVALKTQLVDMRNDMAAKRFAKMLDKPKKNCKKLTDAQKARMKKMHELKEAIGEELCKENPDKAKATELNNQLLALKKEASLEHFNELFDKGEYKKLCGHPGGHGHRHGHKHGHGHGHKGNCGEMHP